MKFKTIAIFLILLIIAPILSACAGGAAAAASSWPGLAADQETAYLAFNQHIYAINLSNGLEKWRYPVEGSNKTTFFATPVLTSDGQLLAGDYTNTLHSLNPSTGQENWSFSEATDRYVGSPLAVNGSIYAPNAGNQLYALDSNGNQLWEFVTDGPLWAAPTADGDCNCVYLPSMDHYLYAVNVQDGTKNWQSEEFGGSIVGSPAISPDGILYIGTFSSQVMAVDSQDGSIIWQTPTDDWVWGGPILKDDVLYVGDLSGTVYAIDAKTGAIKWQNPLDGDITGSPLVTDDTIYVATESGGLSALDFSGNILWNKQFSGSLHTTPVSSGDLILVAATGSDELLYALDNTGNQKWAFIPEKK